MDRRHLFLLLSSLWILISCQTDEKHFISDESYRAMMEADLQARIANVGNTALFDILNEPMSLQENEAMKFLYAYMPLGDITDYSGEYFLENVRASFNARKEMSWGSTIPEDVFRHFVLPVRVNNENLDESRMVFQKELKDRISGLSLYDAVLEINHWCHERVIYTPSDGRTSSPLASVKTAYGRCGEESTFTVAALRSVGIPARQVYTPRWAHTDDNHAWVEAWVDGRWYFLGACEPEPVLNLGWFNAPASRGMLMHTKVFGKYDGQEEVMLRTPRYTEINVIGNYADTAKTVITVVDETGNIVPEARVEFKIYNYAEFYTVANKVSDDKGEASLTAGKGDMLVWASKEGRFGFSKVSFGKDKTMTIKLDKQDVEKLTLDLDIVAPSEKPNLPEVSEEQRAENTRRMAMEDSIRNIYVSTFIDKDGAKNFAKSLNIDEDKTVKVLVASRGNYATIEEFLNASSIEQQSAAAFDLLDKISAKDLRDISLDVLNDHYMNSPKENGVSDDIYSRYVRNPRVANEMLTPYKSYFQSVISESDAVNYRNNPMALVAWVKENIHIDKDCNLGGAPISPEGVWKSRMANAHSRDIFFVSLCRSLGIPARIDDVTGKVQLAGNGFVDIDFEAEVQTVSESGTLTATYNPTKFLDDPKYYSHFTLSRIVDGQLKLLNYDEGDMDMGRGATWSTLLRKGLTLDAGDYLLVSGTRMASGSVLSELSFFSIEPGKKVTVNLEMRENKDDVQVIGNFNSENKFMTTDGKETSLLATTGRGYYVVAILGSRQEPTNHAMRDIAAVKKELEAWGRTMVLLFPDDENFKKFDSAEFGELPGNIVYGIDIDHKNQHEMVTSMKLSHSETLPIFLIADTFNRVVFVSQGYTIGLGAQLLQVINKL